VDRLRLIAGMFGEGAGLGPAELTCRTDTFGGFDRPGPFSQVLVESSPAGGALLECSMQGLSAMRDAWVSSGLRPRIRLLLTLGTVVIAVPGVTKAQPRLQFPLGDASLHGRIYDSVTALPIPRARICREYSVPIYGRALRCANVDTLGRYSFDSLTVGSNTVTVTCTGRNPIGGKQLADLTVVLGPGERRAIDFRSTLEGCDPRPFRILRGTFRGHYSGGFEQSEFIPCASDAWFTAADTAGAPGFQRRAWVSWPRTPVPGGPKQWPRPRLGSPPWDYPQYYVRWSGVLEGPGIYGHMGVSGFDFVPDSIVEVRTPGPRDCQDNQE